MNYTILLLLIGAVALSNCQSDNERPARRRPSPSTYFGVVPNEDLPVPASRPERRRPVAPRNDRPQYDSSSYREQDPQYQFDDLSEPAQVQPAPVRRRPTPRRAPRPAPRPAQRQEPRPVQRPAPRQAPRPERRPERRPARRPERPVEPVEETIPAPYQAPIRSQQSIRPNQLPIYDAESYKGESAVDAIGHSSQKGVLDLLNLFYDIDPEVGIIGKPGNDFPTHADAGTSDFSCSGRSPGYYADVAKGCQVYYHCGPNGNNRQSFLCVNGTIFNQRTFTCGWWYDVNCADSEQNYFRNDLLHLPPKESSEESYEDDEEEKPTRRRPAQRQAQRPAQRPAQREAQRPAQREAQRPAQREAQRPAQREAQRPAQRQAQRPAQTQYDDEDRYQY